MMRERSHSGRGHALVSLVPIPFLEHMATSRLFGLRCPSSGVQEGTVISRDRGSRCLAASRMEGRWREMSHPRLVHGIDQRRRRRRRLGGNGLLSAFVWICDHGLTLLIRSMNSLNDLRPNAPIRSTCLTGPHATMPTRCRPE